MQINSSKSGTMSSNRSTQSLPISNRVKAIRMISRLLYPTRLVFGEFFNGRWTFKEQLLIEYKPLYIITSSKQIIKIISIDKESALGFLYDYFYRIYGYNIYTNRSFTLFHKRPYEYIEEHNYIKTS